MHGFSVLTKHQASMFLANHQNALMDALLIAAYSKKAPYFLTRSDVFNNSFLRAFFGLLRMIPIYRLRDGRDNLSRNQEIFETCAHLLQNKQSILIFPEANHNIQRRVRPLSTGFTRILFHTLDKNPKIDIQLLPVGVNYKNAAGFPDSAAFYAGTALNLKELYNSKDLRTASKEIRAHISSAIEQLTTHIGKQYPYEETISILDGLQPDYLDPVACNALIEELNTQHPAKPIKTNENPLYKIWDGLFQLFNLPVLLIWRGIVRKKISEVEFVSTYRFLFSFLFYPIYYLLLVLFATLLFSFFTAAGLTLLVFIFNLMYIKLR